MSVIPLHRVCSHERFCFTSGIFTWAVLLYTSYIHMRCIALHQVYSYAFCCFTSGIFTWALLFYVRYIHLRCVYRALYCNVLMWRCVYRASYCNALMTNEMHNSYNQFYSTVFCLLYMFRRNLVIHYQEHKIMCCITQFGSVMQACLQAFKPCSWWWTTSLVRNM